MLYSSLSVPCFVMCTTFIAEPSPMVCADAFAVPRRASAQHPGALAAAGGEGGARLAHGLARAGLASVGGERRHEGLEHREALGEQALLELAQVAGLLNREQF